MTDPVLMTLLLPFDDGALDWPETPALFLRARPLDAPRDKLICEQSFKPTHDALVRVGFTMHDGEGGAFPMVLVLPPRQREEYRALLARAVLQTQAGGLVLACVSNLEGAKTVENDLKSLCGEVSSLSKHKCRAFWTRIAPERLDNDLIRAWAQLDAPRRVENGYLSRPGVFAWDRLDAGSQLLAAHLPAFSGVGADLGAGIGYLSDVALKASPAITRLDLIEAEARALDLARLNLDDPRADFHWLDATQALPDRYDFILSNPPFHIDRADRHDLGQAFIRSAAAALKPGGQFWMVANRHLPYEETMKAAFKRIEPVANNDHYKVLKAVK
ncbi:MAG: class I SAM-dependent methyltransferase [Asticcacaulis sp.]|uniref:class I SAM-dependent methyltransferase n=1 Tax=Asticcacaulis sp. TaxID=1872648 RepID=UPI003F7C67FC